MAKTAAHAAQRQKVLAREQLERLRLQLAIPDAQALTIQLTARLLVARNLDANAPKGMRPGEGVGEEVARRYAGAVEPLRLRR
jgi:hypothetical protein